LEQTLSGIEAILSGKDDGSSANPAEKPAEPAQGQAAATPPADGQAPSTPPVDNQTAQGSQPEEKKKGHLGGLTKAFHRK
ncbi:MAG TPA: hypothetical protein VFK03_01435, partial [Candidatus Saccharimonadales bacterium]|nr:hypothetical protein [Candidatus Saccharimonadales bacterium]